MISENKKAPAFTLPSTEGKVRLSEYAGSWVVLYFYPRDMTSGCTVQAQDFRDLREEFEARDAVIIGVSRDSLESHEKFVAKEDLNFPLLSDPDAKVIEKYGAWGEKNMYGKKSFGIIRTTVVIDPRGKVRKIFPRVRAKGHADKVLSTLDELQSE